MAIQDAINGLNAYAFQLIKSIANPPLTSVMQYLALSVFIVVPLLVIYLYLKKDRNLFSFVVALVVLAIVGEIAKLLLKEPRPCSLQTFSWTTGCESGFALPSDHATALTSIYLFIDTGKYLQILYLVWLILVLFGRVYLGLHYLTDIIAGVVLSVILAVLISRHKNWINAHSAKVAHRLIGPLFGQEWL